MLANGLVRAMPQTAHVVPPNSRIPKSLFVRYAYANRNGLLGSRSNFQSQLKKLPLPAQVLLSQFVSQDETAFATQSQSLLSTGSFGEGAQSPNNADILRRYFDFAWNMAENPNIRPSEAGLDASFSSRVFHHNLYMADERDDHWESRSSSMSSVAVNVNGIFQSGIYNPSEGFRSRSASSIVQMGGKKMQPESHDHIWNSRVGQRLPENNNNLLSKPAKMCQSNDDDNVFSPRYPQSSLAPKPTPTSTSFSSRLVTDPITNSMRAATSPLAENLAKASRKRNEELPKSSTLLDSGHSSLQGSVTAIDEQESIPDARNTPTDPTADSSENAPSPSVDEDSNEIDTVETVMYVQTHGPLSMLALVPSASNYPSSSELRHLYDILLPIMADVCSLLMHLNSESKQHSSNDEAVVVSFDPDRQRLHRLSLCRACNDDIRFDSQLFGIQRMFSLDQSIRDLQLRYFVLKNNKLNFRFVLILIATGEVWSEFLESKASVRTNQMNHSLHVAHHRLNR